MSRRGLFLAAVVLLLGGLSRADDPQRPSDRKDPAVGKEDIFPFYEHGVGRWLAFDAPVEVRHELETRGLKSYKVTFTADVLLEQGRQPHVELRFKEEGEFREVIRPRMPGTSHVQLRVGGKLSAAFPIRATAHSNEGDERLTNYYFAQVPLEVFRRMSAARELQAELYWQSTNGKEVTKNDLRTLLFDAKTLRTLARLSAASR
jgi:hypothetical protein